MYIYYLGHAAFRLRGKDTTVVTDPFDKSVGWTLAKQKTDIVTVSHSHTDHNALNRVEGTANRKVPYVVSAPGEYEISGVGVFGWGSYHDSKEGEERGKNTIYNIHIDGVRVVHLGDLGHVLSDELIEDIGEADVVLVPVGGVYTITAEQAVEVVNQMQPAIVIPMHYKTKDHDKAKFGELDEVEVFLKEIGAETVEQMDKLRVTESDLPEEMTIVRLTI